MLEIELIHGISRECDEDRIPLQKVFRNFAAGVRRIQLLAIVLGVMDSDKLALNPKADAARFRVRISPIRQFRPLAARMVLLAIRLTCRGTTGLLWAAGGSLIMPVFLIWKMVHEWVSCWSGYIDFFYDSIDLYRLDATCAVDIRFARHVIVHELNNEPDQFHA